MEKKLNSGSSEIEQYTGVSYIETKRYLSQEYIIYSTFETNKYAI